MTIIATPRCRNPLRSRRSLTGHSGARSNTQLAPRLDRSSSLNAAAFDRGHLLIHRNRLDRCARSPWRNSYV
jgi:hypothetical protein